MSDTVKCQGCGRLLTPLRDGTARDHNSRRGGYHCPSSGYRLARWDVGQRLRHHTGDLWVHRRAARMSAAAIVAIGLALIVIGLVSRIDDQLQRIADALEASAQADAYQARRTQRLDAEAEQLERRVRGDA